MGGSETVFHGPQQPVTGKAVPFEGEHRVHQVFQHLGSSQHSLLGHMAHQQQGCGLAFGQPLQGGGTFPHLTTEPGALGRLAS